LTYPFVLSWSMMEAMSAGCMVIGADVAPVREMLTNNQTGILTDFFDHDQLAQRVLSALEKPDDYRHLRQNARTHIVEKYDLNRVCLPAQIDLINRVLAL
jgi:glycosyltransferase involved in cell wall biosynthesis